MLAHRPAYQVVLGVEAILLNRISPRYLAGVQVTLKAVENLDHKRALASWRGLVNYSFRDPNGSKALLDNELCSDVGVPYPDHVNVFYLVGWLRGFMARTAFRPEDLEHLIKLFASLPGKPSDYIGDGRKYARE